ncbi:hypothetical protein [Gillisia marina]|uniref:hypothetical protein n=1 Tax=Gillisia marina TaxID=1167637 RepID=UPI00029A6CA2|nr:hypothetical protein [Gillisia marina]
MSKTYSGLSGTRALSKILFNFVQLSNIHLDPNQKESIITVCFNWLIRDEKVAVKAFSMQTLFLCSHENHWIKEDLKAILIKDYSSQSAGYKLVPEKY